MIKLIETKKVKPNTYKGMKLEDIYHEISETEYQNKLNQIRKETEK